jgi:hypothetical protein
MFGGLHRLASAFASLFESPRPAEQPQRLHLIVLVAILAAGTALRLWDLGGPGLHGDEETMAMPTMHIVEHGTPLLPSGMFYPRAIAQLYLMAGSVALFGESEWALRLPSVLCGVLLIWLGWRLGQRFLTPTWNLAFAASIAFLPALIEEAQTARMYVFLMACVAGYAILLFEWDRTERLRYLLAAVLVLLLGLQFHTLAVFAVFLTLFPGLLRGDLRRLGWGIGAFLVLAGGFLAIDAWIASNYWQTAQMEGIREVLNGPRASSAIPQLPVWMLACAAAAAVAVGAFVARPIANPRMRLAAGALFAFGLLAQLLFANYAALLLYVAALVVARRENGISFPRLAGLVILSVVLAAVQLVLLRANGVESIRQMLGAMAGKPSVWPLYAVTEYSLVAIVLALAAMALALWRIANSQRVPDFMLFFLLGVWIPLTVIGFFSWDIPPRYAGAQIMPLLLTGVAAAQWLFTELLARREAPVRWATAGAAAAGLLVVNPIVFGDEVIAGNRGLPDHKGAAEFIKSLHLQPGDVLVAEDVLQQTYYLGRVDYWLLTRQVAHPFIYEARGELRDFYTSTRLIGTGAELEALIERSDRGAVYVIGSGENQQDGRRHMRGDGIYEVLASPKFERVFTGRDHVTHVWKVPAPDHAHRSRVAEVEQH